MASVAMEVEHVFRSVKTGGMWWEVWRTHSFGQEIVCLIGQCVLWLIVFYSFYRCKLFFHGRQREARQNKLLKADRNQSLSERADVDQYWPWPEDHHVVESTSGVNIPRRRRSSAKKMPAAEEVPRLVPVIVCTPECSRKKCLQRLSKSASELRAPCQEIKCLEASGLLIQTKLNLLAEPANKLRGIVATAFCSMLTVQLGRWRACFLVDGRVKTVKLDETDRVPVILHSSYAAGLLTIEGINLTDATIQTAIIASKGDGRTLETEYNEGAGGLEIHTCRLELDEIKKFVEMSVVAFREIEKDGHELRVSSLPVQIQDDNLRMG